VPVIFPGESGLLSLDAGPDLPERDAKAQPWQRDGFSGSRRCLTMGTLTGTPWPWPSVLIVRHRPLPLTFRTATDDN